MKYYRSTTERNIARKKRMRYFIVIFLVLLGIVVGFFIKWRLYISSIPDKKIYFEDSFDGEKLKWKVLDAKWESTDNGASGVALLSRKDYAAPYLMSVIPAAQSPNESFVCYIKVKPISFTNDCVIIASFILPTDPITVVINREGQIGVARNLFEKPIYSSIKFDFKENKWHDIYIYVNNTDKKITLYVDNVQAFQKDLIGETYPVQEIWLGALWLNGGGNYGAPVNIAYDSISIGNTGTLPKLSFKDYVLNFFINSITNKYKFESGSIFILLDFYVGSKLIIQVIPLLLVY